MSFADPVTALKSPDWLIRARAAEALGEPSRRQPPVPGDPRAIEPLLDAAPDPTKNVRWAVIGALWAIAKTAPTREVRDRIVEAFDDERWRVRFAAVRAYGLMHGEPFEPVVPVLEDEIKSVRWGAADALYSLSGKWPGREERPDARRPLARVMNDPSSTIRAVAVKGFASLEGEGSRAAAIAATNDSDWRVRLWTVMSLGSHGEIARVVALLSDRHPWVAQAAARVLGERHRRDAVPALIDALSARNHDVRAGAVRALGDIRDDRAFEPLLELLNRLTRSHVREIVVDVLGRWGDPRARPALQRLAESDDRIASRAAMALVRIRQGGKG